MTAAGGVLARRPDACETCCLRASVMWAEDEVMTAALTGRPLPTDAIDAMTPWRARLVVTVCLRAGARLQDGDEQSFTAAATAAGSRDPNATGWWRPALKQSTQAGAA